MKRSDMVEQAKVKKAAMETAGGMLTDEQAAAVPSLYDEWQMGQTYEVGMRRRYLARLYRCQQTHVAQYTPDLTPALWVVIDEAHAGTVEDPIPAARGMEYTYGKHYLDPEDGKTYLCYRNGETGTVVLQYLPHELAGHYFAEVSN